MALLGHCSKSTVKAVFACTLTLYVLVSKGIARTGILEMLHAPGNLHEFLSQQTPYFENLLAEYHLVSIHVDHSNSQSAINLSWRSYYHYV